MSSWVPGDRLSLSASLECKAIRCLFTRACPDFFFRAPRDSMGGLIDLSSCPELLNASHSWKQARRWMAREGYMRDFESQKSFRLRLFYVMVS